MPKDKIVRGLLYLAGIAVLISLSFFRVFETYELQTLDLRFKLRPPLKTSPEIVIIEIGTDSTDQLGRWPFSRLCHAELIDVLHQVGVRAIVFDIVFSEKSPDDEELITQTQKAQGLVYYPISFAFQNKTADYSKAIAIECPIIKGLEQSAAGIGHISVVSDADGKIRRAPLLVEYGGKEYSALAYRVALDYLGKRSVDIPRLSDGTVLINYAGRWTKTFEHYSFADILKAHDQTTEGQESRINLAQLYNKVCFIGLTDPGLTDIKPVPLDPAYPMVGLHANLFNSIIQNKFLFRANRSANAAILFILCLAITIIVTRTKPRISLAVSLSIIFLFIIAAFASFIIFGVWIDLFCPVVVAFGVYLGVTFSRYLVEQRKRLLMDQELEIAKKIQLDFLPQSVPQKSGIQIAASIITAKAVGGDLYDFVDVIGEGKGKLGIMIGDVSGKGTPAALFMARSIADFRHIVALQNKPSLVLNDLNTQIALNYKSGLFITMFYMIYDSLKKELTFSNGGHMPAICLRSGGKIDLLVTEGAPLGLMETEKYLESATTLQAGDSVILYTDGITEARNTGKEEFGMERLKNVVSKNGGVPAQRMVDAIKADLDKFVGSAPQHDDCTIIVLKIVEEFGLS